MHKTKGEIMFVESFRKLDSKSSRFSFEQFAKVNHRTLQSSKKYAVLAGFLASLFDLSEISCNHEDDKLTFQTTQVKLLGSEGCRNPAFTLAEDFLSSVELYLEVFVSAANFPQHLDNCLFYKYTSLQVFPSPIRFVTEKTLEKVNPGSEPIHVVIADKIQ